MKTQTDSNDSAANAVIPTEGDNELDVMAVAIAADAETPDVEQQPSKASTGTKKQEKKPEGGDKPAAGDGAKPGEAGKPADGADKKKEKAAKPGEQGAEGTPFDKAKKERERQEGLLRNFQQEKEAFRAEKAAIDAELQGLRREVTEMRKRSAGPAKDQRGLTVTDYEKLESDYKKEGRDDMAQAAREAADALRKQGGEVASAATGEPWTQPEFRSEWEKNTQELIQQHPELAEAANPLVVATNKLVQDSTYGRFFKSHPAGIKAAYDVACLMRDAAGAGELKKQLTAKDEELATSKKEIERLNGLLQPRGSHPPGPKGQGTGEMTDADVRAIAAAADRGELDN